MRRALRVRHEAHRDVVPGNQVEAHPVDPVGCNRAATDRRTAAAGRSPEQTIMARRCYFAGLAGGRRVVGGTMPVETAAFGFLAALGLRVSRPPLFFPPIARLLASPRTVCTATTLRLRPGGLLDGTASVGGRKALWASPRAAERSARDHVAVLV